MDLLKKAMRAITRAEKDLNGAEENLEEAKEDLLAVDAAEEAKEELQKRELHYRVLRLESQVRSMRGED